MPVIARRLLLLLMCLHGTALFAASAYIVDGDGDNVSDEIDDCPYTHVGVQVDGRGCAIRRDDSDLDGVPDDDDDCPYSVAGAVIDAKGCALDADFDGVADGIDRCPSSPLAKPVDALGCAVGERPTAMAARPVTPAPTRPRAVSRVPAPATAQPLPAPVPVPVLAAPAPIIAVSPPPVGMPAASLPSALASPAMRSTAEAPKMRLMFDFNSARLGAGDKASISGYARIFLRQLNSQPGTILSIKAYADSRETDTTIAVARMTTVRKALREAGIPAERVRAENSVFTDGDAGHNRRVEAEVSRP